MSYLLPAYLSYVYSPPLVATPWSVATVTSYVYAGRRPVVTTVTTTFNYFRYYTPVRSVVDAPTPSFYFNYPWRAPVVWGRYY